MSSITVFSAILTSTVKIIAVKRFFMSPKSIVVIIALLFGLSLSTFPAELQPLAPGEYITALDWDSDGSHLAFGTGQLLLPWPDDDSDGGSRVLVMERGGDEQFAPLCATMDETTSPSKFSIAMQGGEPGQIACQHPANPIQRSNRKPGAGASRQSTNGASWRKPSGVSVAS